MEETVIKETLVKKMNKTRIFKKILLFVFSVWLIFSVFYISFNEFNKTRMRFYAGGYRDGYVAAVKDLIDQAKDCSVIPVKYLNKQIQIINYSCVKNQNSISAKQTEKTENKKR
jgi:hypothetical protein